MLRILNRYIRQIPGQLVPNRRDTDSPCSAPVPWETETRREAVRRRKTLHAVHQGCDRNSRRWPPITSHILEIGEGTSEVQKMLIARELGLPA